jgi:hypothetical protein
MGGMYGTSGESQNELRQNWQVLDATDSKAGVRPAGARLPTEALLARRVINANDQVGPYAIGRQADGHRVPPPSLREAGLGRNPRYVGYVAIRRSVSRCTHGAEESANAAQLVSNAQEALTVTPKISCRATHARRPSNDVERRPRIWTHAYGVNCVFLKVDPDKMASLALRSKYRR